jgi:hypothetical protein
MLRTPGLLPSTSYIQKNKLESLIVPSVQVNAIGAVVGEVNNEISTSGVLSL